MCQDLSTHFLVFHDGHHFRLNIHSDKNPCCDLVRDRQHYTVRSTQTNHHPRSCTGSYCRSSARRNNKLSIMATVTLCVVKIAVSHLCYITCLRLHTNENLTFSQTDYLILNSLQIVNVHLCLIDMRVRFNVDSLLEGFTAHFHFLNVTDPPFS